MRDLGGEMSPSGRASAVNRGAPRHFRDPLGLVFRVLRRGGVEGRFAVWLSGLALLTTPIDLLLQHREQRIMAEAGPPTQPIVLVCGPARSGTTVMSQLLCRSSPVSYLTNLTAIFPRSPVAASLMTGVMPSPEAVPISSHYGRTAGLAAPNDGLHPWDRWLGGLRTRPDLDLLERSHDSMQRFFGAYEKMTGRPLVTKYNILNSIASEVARALPTARFVCMERQPLDLAQSLLVARSHVHGTIEEPYGLSPPSERLSDPIADVVRQVKYLLGQGRVQASLLGPERFRMVSYEDLCVRPREIVSEISREWLGVESDPSTIPPTLTVSDARKVDDETYNLLQSGLADEPWV